jgi:hypothetical protein
MGRACRMHGSDEKCDKVTVRKPEGEESLGRSRF